MKHFKGLFFKFKIVIDDGIKYYSSKHLRLRKLYKHCNYKSVKKQQKLLLTIVSYILEIIVSIHRNHCYVIPNDGGKWWVLSYLGGIWFGMV